VRKPASSPSETHRPKADQRQPHTKAGEDYDSDCFLNFPFDSVYLPLQEALVFAVTALASVSLCIGKLQRRMASVQQDPQPDP